MRTIILKFSFLIFFALLPVVFDACEKNNAIAVGDNNPTLNGTGTVEGHVGYFSPALPPPGSNLVSLPSGYVFSQHHWLTDSPKCSYSFLYLEGKENELRNAIYVKASGPWRNASQKTRSVEFHYIVLSVDSLQIIQSR